MKSAVFQIIVEKDGDWDSGKVYISESIPEGESKAGFFMCATEYMIYVFASQISNLGYDKALELLVKGAKTYKDLGATA